MKNYYKIDSGKYLRKKGNANFINSHDINRENLKKLIGQQNERVSASEWGAMKWSSWKDVKRMLKKPCNDWLGAKWICDLGYVLEGRLGWERVGW